MQKRKVEKYDNINPIVLQYLTDSIGPLANLKHKPRVLDVGCWAGTLGFEVKNRGIPINIDGIDIEKNMLKIAKKRGYENVYKMDLNHLNLDEINNSSYEVIILGDVLEHLVNPSSLLCNLAHKLVSDGCIIISLPNIAFIKYRLLHLAGNWTYKESGIMDKTHLKFFTLDSMIKLIENNNLKVVKYQGFAAVKGLQSIIKPLATVWPRLFALQIVFKVRK